jgi:sporulation protein YlmC with PRC-barrel domain
MHLSASTIRGTKVRNSYGEDLGRIEDLMLDTLLGEVDYAVISFGGFLGLADKLFAVPLQAMQVDTTNEEFVLDESKERLEEAPGFDKDNWPKKADLQWLQQVREFYKVA